MPVFNMEETPRLTRAILLYENPRHNQDAFCSVHEVRIEEGHPVIQPGTPATRQGLMAALRTLADDRLKPEILPGHILAKGGDHLVWYRPAAKRPVWFRADKIGEVTANVPHPPLVWFVNPMIGVCRIFAFNAEGRPDAETPLYQAPYFNVWNDGKICTGSAEVPKGDSALVPENWEKMFFESWFTHPNTPHLVKHKEGANAFWKLMLEGRKRVFPRNKLVPLKRVTLGSVFAGLVKEGGN